MRVFADSTGLEWTVYEVKRQGSPKERWSYLPEEYGDGWLCFESDLTKRRLTPVPEHWRESSDAQLEKMLDDAQSVVRTRATVEDRQSAK